MCSFLPGSRLEPEKKGGCCTVDMLGTSESSRPMLAWVSCFKNLGSGGDKEKAMNKLLPEVVFFFKEKFLPL